MSLHLYGLESLFKSTHKATMRSHLLFGQQAVVSESCKNSNNLRMSFRFIQKYVKRSHIFFGYLLIQTLYINNAFSILIEQYFIDTLENILKLFQGFLNTLLNPKNIFYHVHTLLWFLGNNWAH